MVKKSGVLYRLCAICGHIMYCDVPLPCDTLARYILVMYVSYNGCVLYVGHGSYPASPTSDSLRGESRCITEHIVPTLQAVVPLVVFMGADHPFSAELKHNVRPRWARARVEPISNIIRGLRELWYVINFTPTHFERETANG